MSSALSGNLPRGHSHSSTYSTTTWKMTQDPNRDLSSPPPTSTSTSAPSHKARSSYVKDVAITPIAGSTLHSSSSKSVRIDNAGSSHTAYIPPEPSKVSECAPYREPELVMDEDTPGQIPTNDSGYTDDVWQDPWTSNQTEPSWTWPGINSVSHKIEINGRDEDEETNWWNEEIRAKSRRPGPGILPPALAEALHNPEHALYSVSINTPLPKTGTSSGDRPPSSSPLQTSSSSAAAASPKVPPTMEETRTAIPHPNAYYCKEHNGWVLLLWRFSTVLPQLADSYKNTTPLPDHTHRKRTTSCIREEPPFGQSNKTHHFHLYAQAVDARKLNPPFMRSVWEDQHLKRKRRKLTLTGDEISASLESIDPNAKPGILNDPIVEEGDLLDLYVCCQCSLYCLVSQVIPGVIPAKYMEELSKERYTNPMLNKTPVESVIAAWETVLTYVSSCHAQKHVSNAQLCLNANTYFGISFVECLVSSRIDFGKARHACYPYHGPGLIIKLDGRRQCALASKSFSKLLLRFEIVVESLSTLNFLRSHWKVKFRCIRLRPNLHHRRTSLCEQSYCVHGSKLVPGLRSSGNLVRH